MSSTTLVFNVAEEASNKVTIDVNTEIGPDQSRQFGAKEMADRLQTIKDKEIVLRINSPGGSVSDALQIYDLLNQHPKPVRTEIYGASASAATIIAQAGFRTMSENALYLVHHAWGITLGNKFDMRNTAKDLEKFDQRIMNIYQSNKADMKKVKKFMSSNGGHGNWINAEEALEAGLIDQVIKAKNYNASVCLQSLDMLGLPKIPESYQVKQYKAGAKQNEADAKHVLNCAKQKQKLSVIQAPKHKVITL